MNNAFFNGDLEETIYVVKPKGCEDPKFPSYVCKLNKSLYGLKQAPQAWYDKLRKFLLSLCFQWSASYFSLFHKNCVGSLLLILVYVDDILVTRDSQQKIASVIQSQNAEFALKTLGDVNYFLGIEVHKVAGSISFKLDTSMICSIVIILWIVILRPPPMTCATKLSKIDGVVLDNPTIYRSAIGLCSTLL